VYRHPLDVCLYGLLKKFFGPSAPCSPAKKRIIPFSKIKNGLHYASAGRGPPIRGERFWVSGRREVFFSSLAFLSFALSGTAPLVLMRGNFIQFQPVKIFDLRLPPSRAGAAPLRFLFFFVKERLLSGPTLPSLAILSIQGCARSGAFLTNLGLPFL